MKILLVLLLVAFVVSGCSQKDFSGTVLLDFQTSLADPNKKPSEYVDFISEFNQLQKFFESNEFKSQ